MNDSLIKSYIEKFVKENNSRLQLYKKHLHVNVEDGNIMFVKDAEDDFLKFRIGFNIEYVGNEDFSTEFYEKLELCLLKMIVKFDQSVRNESNVIFVVDNSCKVNCIIGNPPIAIWNYFQIEDILFNFNLRVNTQTNTISMQIEIVYKTLNNESERD